MTVLSLRDASPVGVLGRPVPAAASRRAGVATRPWLVRYARVLICLDLLVVVGSVALTAVFTPAGSAIGDVPVAEATAGLVAAMGWMAYSFVVRSYEQRHLGSGSEEYKRVFSAGLRLVITLALVSFVFQLPTSRLALAMLFFVGTPALLVERYAARQVLHRFRVRGRCMQHVVAVGTRREVAELTSRILRDPCAGLEVVGACVAGGTRFATGAELPVPVLGTPADVLSVLASTGADTVAVAGSRAMSSEALRQLAWQLEGTGVDLVVAPAITDVAGPRIHIRPVAGLPLLHVEEPELAGARRLLKLGVERLLALLLVLLLLPVGLAIAAAIKITDPGPIFYHQVRVGLRGREFKIWKFRTMVADADRQLAGLSELNEAGGLLFKMRRDPRVTRFGQWLRRFSLDELPQLINVVTGSMALVGPRPPLPAEVAEYGVDVRRRLLVKPGVTGLWQVSGRSDLSWDESVRLDLHYVENWSPALDLMIIWKTCFAVLHGKGAY